MENETQNTQHQKLKMACPPIFQTFKKHNGMDFSETDIKLLFFPYYLSENILLTEMFVTRIKCHEIASL
jgi:hypothetical protein